MRLLSDRKLLIYLRCYSICFIFISFCVIVSIVVQEPERIVSILGYSIFGMLNLILFVLSCIKKIRLYNEQYIFFAAILSAFMIMISGITPKNIEVISLGFLLLLSFSVSLYSIYSGKILSNKFINICRIITVVIAVALGVYYICITISFLHQFREVNMDFANQFRITAILVLSGCFYIFNILFFPINAYRLMLSKAGRNIC